jgi:hypothetical protein
MENTFKHRGAEVAGTEPDSEIRRRIFDKVRQKMIELGVDDPFHPEPSADIVITTADKSLLFQPQNPRALEILSQYCGFGSESFAERAFVRVHPAGSRKIINDLTFAGLKITHGEAA